jgi:hypothetical protein
MEDKIRAAILEALRSIPELKGCLPASIAIDAPSLSYHVEFDLPVPVPFAGA